MVSPIRPRAPLSMDSPITPYHPRVSTLGGPMTGPFVVPAFWIRTNGPLRPPTTLVCLTEADYASLT